MSETSFPRPSTSASSAAPPSKGERTKLALKAAAREVFNRSGYLNARVQDISAEAGLSNGAFYRYFEDKRAVMMNIIGDMLDTGFDTARANWSEAHPMDSIFQTTVIYLNFYNENVDLFRLLNEVSQFDSEVEAQWAEVRLKAITRIERMLHRAEKSGAIRPGVDIEVAATLLTAMTDQYAYLWLVLNRAPNRSVEDVSRQLAQIWGEGVFVQNGSSSESAQSLDKASS